MSDGEVSICATSVADRGVLLQGRQHYAAAAGARLDPRSLWDVDEIWARADHRLYGPRDRRPSRHLRLGGVAKKEHANSPATSTLSTCCRPAFTKPVSRRNPPIPPIRPRGRDWVMRCEQRTLDDIRAMGGNTAEDERRFATAARVSEINLANYRNFVQPWVRAAVIPQWRSGCEMASASVCIRDVEQRNAAMTGRANAADKIREDRKPVAEAIHSSPFRRPSRTTSSMCSTMARLAGSAQRSACSSIYGSPALQAAVGVEPDSERLAPSRKMSPSTAISLEARIAELKSQIGIGGLRESVIRGLLYVGLARGMVDERSLEALRRLRADVTVRGSRSRNSRRSCASNSSCCCSTGGQPGGYPELLPTR